MNTGVRSPFWAIAIAIVKGFARDRAAVFFALVFPLMFLVLFGGIFNLDSTSRLDVIQVGDVALVDSLPPGAREAFDDTFAVTESDDLEAALTEVRKGDADAAIEMQGGTLVAHYTQTDQVKAAMTQGALRAFVDGANVATSGQPPQFDYRAERVEDESLEAIQFVTPGLLGWAIAMSASFGAAATLQGWRQTKLMRRLQLSPVPARTIVGARVLVTVLVALVQMAIFLGLGFFAFGLQLTGWWWMSVPLLVVGTLCFMSLGLLVRANLLHGGNTVLDRGGGQHGQLPGAADGVPQRLVLPPRRSTRVAAEHLAGAPAATPQRRHARPDGPRRRAVGHRRTPADPHRLHPGHDRAGGAAVPLGHRLTRPPVDVTRLTHSAP